ERRRCTWHPSTGKKVWISCNGIKKLTAVYSWIRDNSDGTTLNRYRHSCRYGTHSPAPGVASPGLFSLAHPFSRLVCWILPRRPAVALGGIAPAIPRGWASERGRL